MLVVFFSSSVALSQINHTTNQQVNLKLNTQVETEKMCLKMNDKHFLSLEKNENEVIGFVSY
jgi:hypothetical protein